MKTYLLTLLLFASHLIFAQTTNSGKTSTSGGLLKKAGGLFNKVKKGNNPLTTEEIVSGLKEALSVGSRNSSDKLSAVDGFFANAAIKVLMPAEAKKVESTLRGVGMGHIVDKAILSMNRGAEEASKSAAPIFLNAIKQMSFQDALGILKGSDSAATSYLKSKTFTELSNVFRPIIEEALRKTEATKYWKDVFASYNKLPTTFKKINPDLSGFVTEKALSGLFYQVALEEQQIRKNPAARVNDLLKKVFGN